MLHFKLLLLNNLLFLNNLSKQIYLKKKKKVTKRDGTIKKTNLKEKKKCHYFREDLVTCLFPILIGHLAFLG